MFQNRPPDEIYAELFDAVQSSHVFPDSKTFPDAAPKADPDSILKSYRASAHEDGFDLGSFIRSNFDLPKNDIESLQANIQRPVREQIDLLWDVLTRAADKEDKNTSLIALPHPYVVPGGRFREIYYWDTYFTMLGLATSGRVVLLENMINNFAYLIDRVGFIPNGNRTYYCTRSQPPLFVLMVELLATVKQDQRILASYLGPLEKEYNFWMSGSEQLSDNLIVGRRVTAVNNGFLNRYWDDSDLPRQESHAEDVELAKHCDRDAASLYRDIRSACESGWDFSSRWLADQDSLATIQASQIVPVDLNAIMYKLESTLAHAFRIAGNVERAKLFEDRANQRKHFIQSLFFDDKEGFFVDMSLPDLRSSGILSLAAAFPLFFELATPKQAANVVKRIQDEFLAPGGWLTTLQSTGQQWDKPNGWAPLQWIVFTGLKNYGFAEEADLGAKRWVENNLNVYRQSGRLLEKYDVEHIGAMPTGGEYAVQDGFGWTNAVLLEFMNHLGLK